MPRHGSRWADTRPPRIVPETGTTVGLAEGGWTRWRRWSVAPERGAVSTSLRFRDLKAAARPRSLPVTPILPLAAALLATPAPFDAPVTDEVLAASSSGPAFTAPSPPALAFGYPGGRAPVADQMDAWWSEEGLLLIADALRPVPAPPAGLFAGKGDWRIGHAATVSAGTRP